MLYGWYHFTIYTSHPLKSCYTCAGCNRKDDEELGEEEGGKAMELEEEAVSEASMEAIISVKTSP